MTGMQPRLFCILAAAGLGMVLASCGGGAESPAAPPPQPPAPPAPDPPPVPDPPPLPPPPVNLMAIPGDAQVTLTWDHPPVVPEGARISHYEAAGLTSGGELVDDVIYLIPFETPTVTFEGLTNGEPYQFLVLSADDQGTPDNFEDDLLSDPATVTATPEAPVVPTVSWIGFVDETATLFEGGVVRALIATTGEPVDPTEEPFPLEIRSAAADDRVSWEDSYYGPGMHGLVIRALEDSDAAPPATYNFTLEPGGLPPGVGLAEGKTVLRVTVHDVEAEPDCSDLSLTASRVRRRPLEWRVGTNEVTSWGSGEITFQGPQRAALRIVEPYWVVDDENPPLAVINPTRLRYQQVGSAHRQSVSLNWFNDLSLTAFIPGCEEVSLEE